MESEVWVAGLLLTAFCCPFMGLSCFLPSRHRQEITEELCLRFIGGKDASELLGCSAVLSCWFSFWCHSPRDRRWFITPIRGQTTSASCPGTLAWASRSLTPAWPSI